MECGLREVSRDRIATFNFSAGDPHDGGPDDWFVPASDGYPDDWFVPESAAPATAQPAPAPQPGTANPAPASRPAARPDPLC
jgi:hypothetical protein